MISDNLYVGSYIALALLTFVPTMLFLFYESKSQIKNNIDYKGRSFYELISQPRFVQALAASAFGYAIMTFLMTATPISMHVMENIDLNKTSIVIQFHVAAMFLPSLLTGYLIKKYKHSLSLIHI